MARFSARVLMCAVLASLPSRAQDADVPEPSAPAASEGLGRLVGALQTGETFKVRATAAVALGRMADARALPALIESLHGDDSFAVRAAAAAAIGRLGDPAGLSALFDALGDPERYVHDEAQEALARFHAPQYLLGFRDALQADDVRVRLAAVSAYGEVMREPSSTVFISTQVMHALGDDDEDVAAAASRAMAALPHDRAVPLLVSGLKNGDSSVRAGCAKLLEKRTDRSAVEPLSALATDTDQPDEVRKAAGSALRQHLEYLDTAAVVRQAGTPGDPERNRAIRLLAVIGDARAVGFVETALGDSDGAIRIAAARAAADLALPRARAALQAAVTKETEPRQKRQLELILKSMH
jgi:HEAT repeat protein